MNDSRGGHAVTHQPWSATVASVAVGLGTDPEHGLDRSEVAKRRGQYGPNALAEAENRSAWAMLASQFANTMIAVLAVAAVVTLLIGDRTDTIVIGAIVVLNACVGFVQEYRAEQAMDALHRLTASRTKVVRDGAVLEVDAVELVPGDVVRLAAGDVVPADLRLFDVQGLRVDEASLTGESEPVDKTARVLDGDEHTPVSERSNMAFKGTATTRGRADGIVVSTGMATELGRIAQMLGTARSETPLQRRLGELGRRLAAAAVAVCAVVFGAGVIRGEPIEEVFLTSVSLAVAAIPEGLPAVVTVSLALGARRMADRRALVRRLPAVETLGSVTVICSDKTGTLTENRMRVERVWTPVGSYTVEGAGYDPVGEISGADHAADDALGRLARVAAACNDAVLHPPAEGDAGWRLAGDPTEGAVLALAGRLGVDVSGSPARVAEIPFDADRRRMVTVHALDSRWWVAVKGAPEALADVLDETDRPLLVEVESVVAEMARDGYRVLALAERWIAEVPDDLSEVESDLRLLGLVGIADPVRGEVTDAVAQCRAAGITAVMITGDHPRTAASVGRRLGLIDHDDVDSVITGPELAGLSDTELDERIRHIRVFARTVPEQKVRIVDAWRRSGAVVAMTGDGVNDAPALQRSDIGVAMGITGTEVSREAADMVLADDNFATIVTAVEEGRRIYDNIRRFVRYLLTTNTGEVAVVLFAPFLGLPLPLTAAQILWINLVTDGLPAVALGLEPAEEDAMSRPPRRPGESILARGLWQHAVAVGMWMAVLTLALYAVADALDWPAQTMVFTTLALLQLGNALAARSDVNSLWHLGLWTNPWLAGAVGISVVAQIAAVYLPPLQAAFDTESLPPLQLLVVVVASTGAFAVVEAGKWRRRRKARESGPDTNRSRRQSADR